MAPPLTTYETLTLPEGGFSFSREVGGAAVNLSRIEVWGRGCVGTRREQARVTVAKFSRFGSFQHEFL